ncbi:glycosyl transferase [Candidatus Methylomirabilis sp.]|uniref:Glycosyl transferase n=1 Tax=Candidatus Methylomirabilis tolerans TaxID=3123416 RepID=A0AAJ1AH98_9BACT|nr:glycosyl transferase [Candidatus Methylomirabilis sp.]
MGDFHQAGVITTLHRLGKPNLEQLEKELEETLLYRPIALVLPCLYSELEGEALPRIVDELAQVRYLREIIVGLGRAGEEEFLRAKAFFAPLPQAPLLLWNDGPRIQALYHLLEERGISAGPDGKGRSAWMTFGYVLARGQSDVIALHDCDILTYHRELLARLCYPVANPRLAFEFAKGYYSRVTDRLHGRVVRLLVVPLIRALQRILDQQPFLTYLDSFRYPLAGEFAMIADLARVNRIPSDWGLEVGVLAQVYRNCAVGRVCQVDLADTYEHKHQDLSATDQTKGLARMAIDITKSILRTLAEEGTVLSDGLLKTLPITYIRTARDMLSRYQNDAYINRLAYDQHQEGQAVEAFAKAIQLAIEAFLADPLGVPLIPNWNRVLAAIPDFLTRLREAVDQDNKL